MSVSMFVFLFFSIVLRKQEKIFKICSSKNKFSKSCFLSKNCQTISSFKKNILFFKNKKVFSKTVFKHTVNIYKFFEVFNIAIGKVENRMIWFAITLLQNF